MENLERSWEEMVTAVVPSERQLHHQQLEFYGFFHFTVNTYTGREWGDGTESPSLFHPERLDAGQWVRSIKAAGMRGAILTCKHHDGFCLWPSRFTSHTVAASPYKQGKGDVVREVADACRREGLKFGVYLSPWDRNQPVYGMGKPYDDYFVNQLTELLTGYGDIFCVWLDGACGEGKNGNVQIYDWERYYETIRRLQPDACISVCGPDIRWCGNEAGDTRPEEWSVVPERLGDKNRIQERSQKAEDDNFRTRTITSSDQDLGSRAALAGETKLIWYPAEVDVSIRPGWFYHEWEDDQIRTLEELVHIYDGAVGGNAMLLLNIPPNKEGLVQEGDVQRLKELGGFLNRREAHNLAETVKKRIDTGTDAGSGLYDIRLIWEEPVEIGFLVLQEDIRQSQRVERFCILDEDHGCVLFEGTTIGYKKHVILPKTVTKSLRIQVTQSRLEPHISFAGVYGF